LQDRIEYLKQETNNIDHEIAHATAHLTLALPPTTLTKHLEDLRNQKKHHQQQIRDVVAEMHRRPALALGCLCFVLIGCPVGIWFGRSDYLSAFITCFLPVAFLYYPILLCCTNHAKQGHSMAYIWAADGLMGIMGLVLFRRLLKH